MTELPLCALASGRRTGLFPSRQGQSCKRRPGAKRIVTSGVLPHRCRL